MTKCSLDPLKEKVFGEGGWLEMGISSLDPLEEKSLGEGKWGYSNLIYVSLILHSWEERLLWRRHRIRHTVGVPQMLQEWFFKKVFGKKDWNGASSKCRYMITINWRQRPLWGRSKVGSCRWCSIYTDWSHWRKRHWEKGLGWGKQQALNNCLLNTMKERAFREGSHL